MDRSVDWQQDQTNDPSQKKSVLDQVREGMAVHDRDGNEVGQVADMYYGTGSDEIEGQGTLSTGAETRDPANRDPANRDRSTLIDVIGEAISPTEDIPEEVQERLLNDGFVRVDRGVLHNDAYVMPAQIDSVSEDGMRLKVKADDLLVFGG